MKTEKIEITGMSCNHCVKSVENEVSKLSLKNYKVGINFLSVEYDENTVTHEQIVKAVENAGYKVVNTISVYDIRNRYLFGES